MPVFAPAKLVSALSLAVSPCSPTGVVVKYVAISKRSREPCKNAVPRERLYRNSDCQISLLSSQAPQLSICHCSARLRVAPVSERSEAESKNPFPLPVKNCAALDNESRNSRRG